MPYEPLDSLMDSTPDEWEDIDNILEEEDSIDEELEDIDNRLDEEDEIDEDEEFEDEEEDVIADNTTTEEEPPKKKRKKQVKGIRWVRIRARNYYRRKVAAQNKEKKIVKRVTSTKIDRVGKLWTIMLKTMPHIDESGHFTKGMSIRAACEEAEVSPSAFYSMINKDERLKKMWEDWEQARKNMMRDESIKIIDNALTWVTKLRPKEQIDVAFKVWEKVEPSKQVVDVKSTNINLNATMSKDEMVQRIMELSAKLKQE